jgi:hypothetical protein
MKDSIEDTTLRTENKWSVYPLVYSSSERIIVEMLIVDQSLYIINLKSC